MASNFPSLADISKARTNARQFGDGTTYALDFNVNGQNYTFVPKNVASNGGVTAGENTYLLPYFTDSENQKAFNKNAQSFDLSSNTGLSNYLKSQNQSTDGYLIPSDQASIDSQVLTQPTSTLGGSLSGLVNTGNGFSYGITGGHGQRYLTTGGEVHDPYTEYSSILGNTFGSVGQGVADFLNTDVGKAALMAASYYGGTVAADALTSGAVATAPEAVAVSSAVAAPETAAAVAAATPSAAPAIAAAVPEQAVAIAAVVPEAAPAIAAAVPEAAAAISQAVEMGTGMVSAETAAAAAPAVGGTGAGLLATAPAANTALADLQPNTAFTGELPAGSAYTAPAVTPISELAAAPALTATDAGLGAIAGTSAAGTTLGELGSGTFATPGDLGTQMVTQGGLANPATVGQITDASLAGASLSPAAIAGTGAAGAGLLGAATTASGELVPATMGLDAGTAAAGAAAGAGLGTAAGGAMKLADILPYTTGASVLSGLLGANAATNSAQIQADAAAKALAQQQANFNTINQQQAPYRAAGYNALNQIGALTTGQTPMYDASGNIIKDASGNPVMTSGTGYFQHQFDPNDLAAGLAPNYNFMLNQGQMANQRAANVGGGGLSGNTLQGLQKYTQDYAGNAYQNAFNNYQAQRSNIYNTLAGIAGIGQTGQSAANTASTNLANAASQLGVGSAAAQAAGQTGATNAYTNAIGNVANNYTLASLLNQGGSIAA